MTTDLKGKGKEQQPPVSAAMAAADDVDDDDFDELDDVLECVGTSCPLPFVWRCGSAIAARS